VVCIEIFFFLPISFVASNKLVSFLIENSSVAITTFPDGPVMDMVIVYVDSFGFSSFGGGSFSSSFLGGDSFFSLGGGDFFFSFSFGGFCFFSDLVSF